MEMMLERESDFSIWRQRVGRVGPHMHNFLELAYIVKGWTEHTLNGKRRTLKAGQFVFLDYGDIHSFDVTSSDLEVINCLFKPSVIDASLHECKSFLEILNSYMVGVGYAYGGIRKYEKIFEDTKGEILQILEHMANENANQSIGYFSIIRAKLIELIIYTMRMIENQASVSMGIEVQWMLDKIRRDPAFPHLLTEYASRFQMRPEALSRQFRKEAGEGFAECLRRNRITLACRLLIESDLPVTEISERSGYLDSKSFRESFHRVMGVSPREYRKHKIFYLPKKN